MKIKGFMEDYEVDLMTGEYVNNGNLAIELIITEGENKGEYFGTLTVNLDEKLPENQAYVDVNNIHDVERFIKEYNLGRPLGRTRQSGFCTYPLYEFNM